MAVSPLQNLSAGNRTSTRATGEVNLLQGSLPPDIGNLTQLTRLNLAMNQLTGEVPESMGEMAVRPGAWGLWGAITKKGKRVSLIQTDLGLQI